MNDFRLAAEELRVRETARLMDATVPRLEALRSMTPSGFRAVVALMLDRLGFEVVNDPTAPILITSRNGKKYVSICGLPSATEPVGSPDIERLRTAVLTHNAHRGFYYTTREFTPEAKHYAETSPIDIVDGKRLVTALSKSRKGVLVPQSYKAMCQQCGNIVEHRIDRGQDESRPCGKGHMVPPTIARDRIFPPHPSPAAPDGSEDKAEPGNRRRKGFGYKKSRNYKPRQK